MKLKKLLSVGLALAVSASLISCGGKVVDEFDRDTTILVSVFNGGNGVEWIEKVITEFNSKNDVYKVKPIYEKKLANAIIGECRTGNVTADCFYTSGSDFQTGIYQDYFEDLSDILDMKVDGASGKTIREKMKNYDLWQHVASKYGEGCYMLPYTDNYFGLVYNHTLFADNGWLTFAAVSEKDAVEADGITVEVDGTKLKFVSSVSKIANYNVGDYILSKGKDGKYGTYDDGQPITEAEFFTMISKIAQDNGGYKPFIYNAIYDHYLNNMVEAIIAQYLGEEQYGYLFSHDSNGKLVEMHDGSSKAITLDNGYEMYKSEGVYKALEFLNDNFNSNALVYEKSFDISNFSHTDAQNDFILGFKSKTGRPCILAEGAWWENEARKMFKSIEDEGNVDYGFGKQEFRYMLYPAFDGQYGIDGNGNGTVFSVMDSGALVVPKCSSAAKLAKIKEFIAMTSAEKVMHDFTVSTGCIMPYEYDLTEDDLLTMTPFQRNVWQIYNDTENVKIVRTQLLKNGDPLTFTSNITSRVLPIKYGAIYFTSYVQALRGLKNMETGFAATGYPENEWVQFVSSAKSAGFFKNN